MNLGFDAISQFPISQVGADNVVTITVTGNNLIANIGNPNISADSVTENITGNQLTLGTGTVTIVGTANLEAPKTPIGFRNGERYSLSRCKMLEASGNNLIIRSWICYYYRNCEYRGTCYRYDIRNWRGGYYYVE